MASVRQQVGVVLALRKVETSWITECLSGVRDESGIQILQVSLLENPKGVIWQAVFQRIV
jgi:hypothetical protein